MTTSEDMEEKKRLATFVKSVHKDLRKKFKNGKLKSEWTSKYFTKNYLYMY